jgi:hypothetical protein
MKNPIPRIQMLDGLNEGWIEFERGKLARKRETKAQNPVLKALMPMPMERFSVPRDQMRGRVPHTRSGCARQVLDVKAILRTNPTRSRYLNGFHGVQYLVTQGNA